MDDKIRIKDIAEQSGVSVGTVDRVLHNRPNVSKQAREKVEAVLKRIDYQPNMYASALAYNRQYTFYCIMPKHESEAYWEEIEEGANKACEARRDFHVKIKIMYYKRFDAATFAQRCDDCLAAAPNGVIIVPSELEPTKSFTDKLRQLNIPFILLDSYMPDLQPLSFYGQDSFCSGYFAAKMLMLIAPHENEIMLMKPTKWPASSRKTARWASATTCASTSPPSAYLRSSCRSTARPGNTTTSSTASSPTTRTCTTASPSAQRPTS